MVLYLRINAHDPLIARDGRPFGLGIRMKSLDWLYPSVLAGSLRTMLGNARDSSFDDKMIESLKCISISGHCHIMKGRSIFRHQKTFWSKKKTRNENNMRMP